MERALDCDEAQAALSASYDGEDPGVPAAALYEHLATCPTCRGFDAAIRMRGRPGTAAGRPSATTLPSRVASKAGDVDRSGVWWVLRGLLVLVACGYLLLEIPELLLSDGMHDAHLSHHMGIFEAAYAVALVLIAVRPARARAFVPFTVVLAVGMVLFAVIDVYRGEAFPLSELSHTLELAGMVLVWMLATRRGWPGRATARRDGAAAGPAEDSRGRRHLHVAPRTDGPADGRRAG